MYKVKNESSLEIMNNLRQTSQFIDMLTVAVIETYLSPTWGEKFGSSCFLK